MYCVMRASVPSLYNVYRRYDIHSGNSSGNSSGHNIIPLIEVVVSLWRC